MWGERVDVSDLESTVFPRSGQFHAVLRMVQSIDEMRSRVQTSSGSRAFVVTKASELCRSGDRAISFHSMFA
eukprot:SAG31_NODE_1992_length_6709_cov_3.654870_7_plen_72_part_00